MSNEISISLSVFDSIAYAREKAVCMLHAVTKRIDVFVTHSGTHRQKPIQMLVLHIFFSFSLPGVHKLQLRKSCIARLARSSLNIILIRPPNRTCILSSLLDTYHTLNTVIFFVRARAMYVNGKYVKSLCIHVSITHLSLSSISSSLTCILIFANNFSCCLCTHSHIMSILYNPFQRFFLSTLCYLPHTELNSCMLRTKW